MGDRAKLTARVIPRLAVGDGTANTQTAPPPPLTQPTPAARAAARFAVSGNAVVTGGAGDLGFAACRALLEHGLQGLVIFDLDPGLAAAKTARLRADFPAATIEFVQVDVTDAEAVTAAVARAGELLGGAADVLLCFAGIADSVPAHEMDAARFDKIVSINATGAFLCAQAVARTMMARGRGGSIVLVASISAHRVNFPQPQAHYNAAKAAVLSLKSSLAAEWRRFGIRVNSVSPGYMNTILNEGDGLDDLRKTWALRNPTGRMGEPDELTGAVVLLASRAGSYINGADLLVDGGQTLFSS